MAEWLEPVIDRALAGDGFNGITHSVNHPQETPRATPQGLRELAEAYAALKDAEAPAPLLGRLETLIREQIKAQRAPTPQRQKALPAPGLPDEQAS